jgi:H+/Cl- antiporter ClcA
MRFAKWTSYAVLSGILSGLAATVFLYALDFVTRYRLAHFEIVWLLPFAGLLIGWIYHSYGAEVNPGTNLILDEIHDPKKVVPIKMAPLILISTVVTHLFGGSAGREGTAVQMGASLSDQISRFFPIPREERKILLMIGAGAGFGAAIGTPIAGVIFGMEVLRIGRLRPIAVWESMVACLFAYGTTLLCKAPHSRYPRFIFPQFSLKLLAAVILLGLACGAMAFAFIWLTHQLEKIEKRWIRIPMWRPFAAGIILMLLFQIPGTKDYSGLGIYRIQAALVQASPWYEPFVKAFFTILTIGSGFKGGEFIPLVYIGTTLGSTLGAALNVPFQLLAALGFSALFGAASMAPIACAVMCSEIFGLAVLPYAFLAGMIAYWFSGRHSIYATQRGGDKLWWYLEIRRKFEVRK